MLAPMLNRGECVHPELRRAAASEGRKGQVPSKSPTNQSTVAQQSSSSSLQQQLLPVTVTPSSTA